MLSEQLQAILALLYEARSRYEKELESLPEGKLVFMKRSELPGAYYVKRVEDGVAVRKGITKQPAMVKGLARKEFVRRSLACVNKNVHVIERAVRSYRPCDPAAIIASMSTTYQSVPESYFFEPLSDGVYLSLDGTTEERIQSHAQWGSGMHVPSDYMSETRTLITSRGERMRSKAEVLIAEKLYQYGIPFRYEQCLEIGNATFYPDFTFEGAQGKEFYLEFCGKMDDEEYVRAHKRKLAAYQAAGVVPWENIVYLYSRGNDINMQRVESMIQTQIIPWL